MTATAGRVEYRGARERQGFERSVRIIQTYDPAVAREFIRTTDILLRDWKRNAGAESWTSGLLNRTGGPLEFSFATDTNHLRYTVEVGGPQIPTKRRLGAIEALLNQLDTERDHADIHERLREIQQGAELQFGAWIGVRHSRNSGETRYKIYAEAPDKICPAATSLMTEYLGSAALPPEAQLVLLGVPSHGDRCEFYFERGDSQLTLDALLEMLGCVELESKHSELVDLIRSFEFRCKGGGGPLPQAQYGFSYSTLPGGAEPVLSIFLFAADLAGGDAFVRHQVLASALGHGRTLGCYGPLTEPMSRMYFQSDFHNMISFSAGSESVGFQISVSPPPEPPEED
jgi:hypothetical protein